MIAWRAPLRSSSLRADVLVCCVGMSDVGSREQLPHKQCSSVWFKNQALQHTHPVVQLSSEIFYFLVLAPLSPFFPPLVLVLTPSPPRSAANGGVERCQVRGEGEKLQTVDKTYVKHASKYCRNPGCGVTAEHTPFGPCFVIDGDTAMAMIQAVYRGPPLHERIVSRRNVM